MLAKNLNKHRWVWEKKFNNFITVLVWSCYFQADVVMVMTCAIREGAEHKVWKKLHYLAKMKRRKMSRGVGPQMKIAILGCMAERLKTQILEREQLVDIVCGPDAYRDLPRCDNMCAYCIVPFTRGRERSRPIDSILEEVRMLSDQGVKEITLLGQNVNSYRDTSDSQHFGLPDLSIKPTLSDGFRTVYRARSGGRRFSDLLDKVSQVDPEMRIRFTAPHPKDFPDEVIELIKDRPTVCGQLHLPAQSGNDDVLSFMRRGYTGQAYRQLVDRVRSILPNVCLTSDFICGFCGESEAAFEDTLALVRDVQYSMVFAYPYSMRQKTHAYHKLIDDVPADIKQARVEQLQQEFRRGAGERNKSLLGHNHLVLVQGPSKKGTGTLFGRNDGGLGVIFPDTEITNSTAQTLHGEGVEISSIQSTGQCTVPNTGQCTIPNTGQCTIPNTGQCTIPNTGQCTIPNT
ncbi:CK5P1-like protein, partial [Mya arenaria]